MPSSRKGPIPMSSSCSLQKYFCLSRLLTIIVLAAILFSMFSAAAWCQTTVSQGSIQGTVTDQTNAVVPDATITITSRTTGQTVTVKTSSAGAYSSGGLPVGDY